VAGKKSLLPDWDGLYRLGTPPWDTGRPAKELLRILDERLVRPGSVLDVGCGTGANAVCLARRRFEVTAVDTSALAIERARLRCERENALVRFVRGNIFELAKTGGRFDFVLDAGFYHFIRQADLERYLDLLWWVTKPGSHCLVLAGAAGETAEGGPPQVTEENIRSELGRLFELLDLRPFQFEAAQRPEGFRGWSCLMKRPALAEQGN
jgi:SAM-dependent methyltransferase